MPASVDPYPACRSVHPAARDPYAVRRRDDVAPRHPNVSHANPHPPARLPHIAGSGTGGTVSTGAGGGGMLTATPTAVAQIGGMIASTSPVARYLIVDKCPGAPMTIA